MVKAMMPEEAARRAAILEAMQLDPIVFAHYASHGTWQPAQHLQHIAKEVLRTVDGLGDRLMVNAPPRSGKSQFLSRFFPAWFLGNHPDATVLLLAYADAFAEGWGRRVRAVLEEWGEDVFGVKVEQNRWYARQSDASPRSWSGKPTRSTRTSRVRCFVVKRKRQVSPPRERPWRLERFTSAGSRDTR